MSRNRRRACFIGLGSQQTELSQVPFGNPAQRVGQNKRFGGFVDGNYVKFDPSIGSKNHSSQPCQALSGRALAAALLTALLGAGALGGCLVRYVVGPRLTGNCGGACDHYVDCRGGADRDGAIRRACLTECPGVFGDQESIMAFESLSCPDAVEFVEGDGRHPPGSRSAPATSSSD